ncbi:MAG: CoA activase [Spirochaetes bacterium]|nr:CoA activase [Spirochaetota bacterium]
MNLYLGIDIGSISINTVLLDESMKVTEEHYTWCYGKPFYVLYDVLKEIIKNHKFDSIVKYAFTGTGGELAVKLLGGSFVNEVVGQSASVIKMYPGTRSIIEMGGEDSKLIILETKKSLSLLEDFAMNSMCAAGTGSFLDQQAKRIGVSIVKEFGELALKSENPPRIAGRCSVFAKTDMIHLQQIATPVHDIVAGLCFAVARNFKSNLAMGKEIEKPVVFQGGVAANAGVVRAFKEILNLSGNDLIIPRYHASMGAIGSVFHVADNAIEGMPFKGIDNLDKYLQSDRSDGESPGPLPEPNTSYNKTIVFNPVPGKKIPVCLGLDIGSLSTNVVLIDDDNNVVARRYLPTASKPLKALREGLSEIYGEVGKYVEVKAAGSTGSGRYLTGDFIGADIIQNEITAQATAAIACDPAVDTIFEIGGQDSKYIFIENSVVTDFEMNKVCAAGTGSFLEEQAEKLRINIINEFGELALSAPKPAALGDRCTVFMESDLNSHQQKGIATDNLVGGLAYSIVLNYLEKVVGTKRIGNRIFFQGGVANNRAVVAAFEKITGKKITVPPHFDVTGAIGAAMLARKYMEETGRSESKFKGFDISKIPYTVDKFICKACTNQCEMRRVRIEGEKKPLYYGGRCEMWELPERKGRGKDIPNYFTERLKLLMGDFKDKPLSVKASVKHSVKSSGNGNGRKTIGIPRGLMLYYTHFPFWRTFFEKLGFKVVLSRRSDKKLVAKSLGMLTAETCFPVELIYGHVDDLIDQGVDYIFLPFVADEKAEPDNPTVNYNCPWIQSHPYMIRAALKGTEHERKLLIPTLHFRYFKRVLKKDLSTYMHDQFGFSISTVLKAIDDADSAQIVFEEKIRKRGETVLKSLPEGKTAAVILGRPYNTCDPLLNLNLIDKLINLDVVPVPIDYLPLESENVFKDYYMMYWPNGRKIIAASRIIARDEKLTAVYLSNFRCGPDSFIQHYVREEMGNKPYLQLEVDEHSADAGMITRLEAFLDSLKGSRQIAALKKGKYINTGIKHHFAAKPYATPDRTLYVPYMNDGVHALAAASRSCGIDAHVLPVQDEEDIRLGRKYLSSRECFPMICTTGSFLKKLMEPGIDPKKTAFFMPDHAGPCRFGQYNKMQRIVFDRLGFKDAEIVAPSNKDSYAGLSGGNGNRFRLAALKGIVAIDLLRKLVQERRPYEAVKGSADKLYRESLDRIIKSTENGAKNMVSVLSEAAVNFKNLPLHNGQKKPVILVVGEVFMRDNPACSGRIMERLERLGAETLVAPFKEWITYSTLRYTRDSRWKGDFNGILKSRIQAFFTTLLSRQLNGAVKGIVNLDRDITIEEMLNRCEPYIGRDYDGDPPIALGSAAALVHTGISGVVNILPFMCAPGTIINSVSSSFRKDNNNLPWINIDYDGQDDTGIETRLEAFMYQAGEYAKQNGKVKPFLKSAVANLSCK